jgi:Ser/Thr protein kinase RdoA (MazF antagonist)
MSSLGDLWLLRRILEHYHLNPDSARIVSLGTTAGFSGADVWRAESADGAVCIRAAPTNENDRKRLVQIHQWMQVARDQALTFIPAIISQKDGSRFLELAGRLWEVQTWLPGRADFCRLPCRERLEAACTALARLHRAWEQLEPRVSQAPCSAIDQRLRRLSDWRRLIESGWTPRFALGPEDGVDRWSRAAWNLLPDPMNRVERYLLPWAARRFFVQPCHGDIWHDHVLFEDNTVSGIVDFATARIDHVAVDLARLLGSLVGDDQEKRDEGISAYRAMRSLSDDEIGLMDILDRTGTVLGIANWLTRLYHDGRVYRNRDAVANRLRDLVLRVESWQ